MEKEILQAEKLVLKSIQTSGSKLTRKYNLSTYFFTPIILDNGYKTKGYINSYLYNTKEDINEYQHIYILMSEEDILYIKHKRYITHAKTNEGFLYTFNIDSYKNDVQLFIKGKYSEFSQELKDLLCKKQSIKNIMLSEVYKILYRTDDRRKMIEELVGESLHKEAELCSIVDIADEIYE